MTTTKRNSGVLHPRGSLSGFRPSSLPIQTPTTRAPATRTETSKMTKFWKKLNLSARKTAWTRTYVVQATPMNIEAPARQPIRNEPTPPRSVTPRRRIKGQGADKHSEEIWFHKPPCLWFSALSPDRLLNVRNYNGSRIVWESTSELEHISCVPLACYSYARREGARPGEFMERNLRRDLTKIRPERFGFRTALVAVTIAMVAILVGPIVRPTA